MGGAVVPMTKATRRYQHELPLHQSRTRRVSWICGGAGRSGAHDPIGYCITDRE
jgi:hypothetical protein